MVFKFNCPHCNQSISTEAEYAGQNADCPTCNQAIQVPALVTAYPDPPAKPLVIPSRVKASKSTLHLEAIERKQKAGYMASVLLFAGIFCPLASMPMIGKINYLKIGWEEAAGMFTLSVVTVWLAATHRFRGLWLTGLLGMVMAAYSLVYFQSLFDDMKANAQKDMKENPFGMIGTLLASSSGIEWGIAVVALGGVFALAGAAMPLKRPVRSEWFPK